LFRAPRVLFERLLLLIQIRAHAVDADAALGQLLLQIVDLLIGSGMIGLALLARLALGRELRAQALVLAHFLIPLLLRIAARDERGEEQQKGQRAGGADQPRALEQSSVMHR
jgi:hypothetical protein